MSDNDGYFGEMEEKLIWKRIEVQRMFDKFEARMNKKLEEVQSMVQAHAEGVQRVYAEVERLESRFNKVMKGREHE